VIFTLEWPNSDSQLEKGQMFGPADAGDYQMQVVQLLRIDLN